MEPDEDERVGGPMQRVNPTVVAAVTLGALILLIGTMILIGSSSSEDDRLTNETSASKSDPSALCGNRSISDEIKREVFRRAAAQRGSDQAAFEKIGSYSTVRMEAPVLRDEDAGNGAVTCNGTITVDLPPGVAVPGGRRSLSADILYTVQSAAGGVAAVVSLANADEIITPLATLVRTGDTEGEGLLPPVANEVAPVGPAVEELPPADNPAIPDTPDPENAAAITPSFNCSNARTSGEVAVCNDYRLAILDRRMAAQFASALSHASPEQRTLLIRTRDAFLGYRDQCTSNDCIAETYRGRMREIRDIMAGGWHPQR